MKMSFLLCSVLAVAMWIAFRDDQSVDHSWTVTVSRDGQTIEESKLACGESAYDVPQRIRAIVDTHVSHDLAKTPQIRIWRSSSQQFQSQSLTDRAAKAGKKVSAIYTQTESIGPVYASTDSDGVDRVYQEDTPGKPEIIAEGRQMDLDLKRSIITELLVDRLQNPAGSERAKRP